jgi:hypothetical protein
MNPHSMSFADQYLRYPDLFPARVGGEPCGPEALALDLPGGAHLFSGLTAEQRSGVERRFGPLCRPPAPGESGPWTRLFRAPDDDFLVIDTRGWEYALDLDPAPEGVRVAGLNLMARLDWPAAGAGDAGGAAGAVGASLRAGLWTCEDEGELFAPVLENLLRAAYAYRLAAMGGALIHSAGVVFDGRAFLLTGPSGAGKTTAASLCLAQGGSVLSDDLNALRAAPGEGGAAGAFQVEKLPFTGDLGETGTAGGRWPLAAVVRLRKGEADAVRPLTPGAAFAALLASAPIVNRDPYRREPLLATLEEVALTVPAYELTFRLGAGLRSILAALPT